MSGDVMEVLEPLEGALQGLPTLLSHLRGRLASLVRGGAALFDPAVVRFIEVLLEKAAALGGGAGLRLAQRAEQRLQSLQAAQQEARAAAQRAVESLAQASASRHVDVDRAFEEGDYAWARRDAERALRETRRTVRPADGSWLRRVAQRASARTVSLPEEVARGLAHLDAAPPDLASRRSAQAVGGALSLALFREAAGAARAQLVVARVLDALPEPVGPYHPQLIAARALAALSELSPLYLRAYLARLEDLSRLELVFSPVAQAAAEPAGGATAKDRGKAATTGTKGARVAKATPSATRRSSRTSKGAKVVKVIKSAKAGKDSAPTKPGTPAEGTGASPGRRGSEAAASPKKVAGTKKGTRTPGSKS